MTQPIRHLKEVCQEMAALGLSAQAREIWRYLEDMARNNSALQCSPKIETIAAVLGCSPRTVLRCIKALKGHGFLSWQKRTGRRTGEQSNLYRISYYSYATAKGGATDV